ncbi:MAG: lycopene cyclase domain-containing protein [Bacteroidota bacterium]
MSLYLILDLAAIAIPFAFSFEKRLQFYKLWRSLFTSILVVGLVFVAWDSYFTRIGVWGFNQEYLSGIFFLNLPIEEYFFFICVPYASVFTFHVFRTLIPQFRIRETLVRNIILFLATALLVTGIIFHSRYYTCSTFLFASVSLFAAYYFFRPLLPHFILSYCFILVPFFLMNGMLTGSFIDGEVVWYNDSENLGIRLLTIPVEDVFYGMSMILWNVNLTMFLQKKFSELK